MAKLTFIYQILEWNGPLAEKDFESNSQLSVEIYGKQTNVIR